jgi:hypothetical protein
MFGLASGNGTGLATAIWVAGVCAAAVAGCGALLLADVAVLEPGAEASGGFAAVF